MFMGNGSFVWWQGVVENRDDPLFLGRCQVRILGLDSEVNGVDTNRGIPTEMLRWCYPLMPVTDASVSGIGSAPVGLVTGTWVFGFFRDGERCQDGIMIGTVGGIPEEESQPGKGFNDPNGVYPKYINEPDTNRLARNENTDLTINKHKEELRRVDIPTAGYIEEGPTWEEPHQAYNAQYPYNKVYESESGHIKEIDDTPGSERTHEYHKSGTFKEVQPDGSIVRKIVGDDFEIFVKGKNVLVQGDVNITVRGNSSFYCQGNSTVQVDGDVKQNIKGHVDQTLEQNVTQTIQGNVTQQVDGNVDQTVNQNVTSLIKGDLTEVVQGNYTLQVTGNITRTAATISDDGGGGVLVLDGNALIDGAFVDVGT